MTDNIYPFPKINFTDLDVAMECWNEAYEAGEIKGLMLVVKNHDNSFVAEQAGELSYFERLGLLEHLKFEVLMDSEPDDY